MRARSTADIEAAIRAAKQFTAVGTPTQPPCEATTCRRARITADMVVTADMVADMTMGGHRCVNPLSPSASVDPLMAMVMVQATVVTVRDTVDMGRAAMVPVDSESADLESVDTPATESVAADSRWESAASGEDGRPRTLVGRDNRKS